MGGPSLLKEPIHFDTYQYECVEEIKLPKVDKNAFGKEFLEVFSGRRSIKELGRCPIEKLSYILYYAIKPYSIARDDYGVTVYKSAAPSAGGRHPIDVIVGLPERHKRCLYLYDALNHSLRRMNIAPQKQWVFQNDVEQTLPFGESTLIWFSVQYMRTASKYSDYMSLVWRDIGAQLCCIQQAAKYVGLDSCPIGYLAEETFDAMFGSDKLISGGGMIVGDSLRLYAVE